MGGDGAGRTIHRNESPDVEACLPSFGSPVAGGTGVPASSVHLLGLRIPRSLEHDKVGVKHDLRQLLIAIGIDHRIDRADQPLPVHKRQQSPVDA
jgi:hypothetical protein